MNSLKKNIQILLYEKENILNSILQYQIANYYDYEIFVLENHEELNDVVISRNFNVAVLNLDNLKNDVGNFINLLQTKNENINIIGYHEPPLKKANGNLFKLFLLEKPFKLVNLLNYLDGINSPEILLNSDKYLMDHIVFSPSKKTVSNLKTKNTEHLTEKENNLLNFFYNKKNEEILKKDLLTKIWGFSEKINTHTLETHIYRLKQKLNKIDNDLSLSLKNKNGLYYLKYND